MVSIVANPQARVKDTYASSPVVGLVVRANGEEDVSVIDARGNILRAGLLAPTVIPSHTGSGTTEGWVGYVYVYAAEGYPFVESEQAINGSLAPHSNASPILTVQRRGTNNDLTVTKTTATNISKIWLFRTVDFATLQEAQLAAEAYQVFYVGQGTNSGGAGTIVISDATATVGVDQLDADNYPAPQFQFVVYYDPYWYGFGNFPFIAKATWTTSVVTVTAPDKWFTGRNNQIITFEGVTTGGFDGNGAYLFKWVTATTGHVLLVPDGTPTTLAGAGAGQITIQGPATTLYRSKRRNPFAWGKTTRIGEALVPELFTLKMGGGLASALATIPNQPLLKLDCEYPAKCYTLNLGAAGTEAFASTLRIVSDQYSVSSHWSQFTATTESGQSVLWGMDFKNFAILQSNGISQIPISGPIPKILRRLTTNRTKQLFTHGCYDPRTELNCIWVSTKDSLSLVNYLIFQHAPSGYWGFMEEHDVLCSASIQDTLTNTVKTFVGTQTGFVGQAFTPEQFNNWLPETGLFQGTVLSGDATHIIKLDVENFNAVDDGLIGNWCLLTDALGEQEQWARISAVTSTQLTFDLIHSFAGFVTTEFNPLPEAGFKFHIGLINCKMRKDFDINQPNMRKAMEEFWITQKNDDGKTLIRFYKEQAPSYLKQFALLQNDGGLAWSRKTELPSNKVFSYGIEILNRAYTDWRFLNWLMLTEVEP